MSKFTAARTPSERRKHTAPGSVRTGGKTSPGLSALQAKADQSPATGALNALQRRSSSVVQREVDKSPGPRMPNYAPNETPGWQKNDRTGVPGWAKDDFNSGKGKTGAVDKTPLLNRDFTTPTEPRNAPDPADGIRLWAAHEFFAQPKVKLIASIKDGKIGSIYFKNGRIRTTHQGGPSMEKHDTKKTDTFQYNLDQNAAWQLFSAKNDVKYLFKVLYSQTDPSKTAEERRERTMEYLHHTYSKWLSNYLIKTPVDQLPDWVTPVPSHDSAFDTDAADPPDNITLFEVFTTVSNGKVESWHPSRGIAAKFETNKQVVSVLKAALRHIDGITDPKQRNVAFYEFVKSRLPEFVKHIRKPTEV